SIVVLAKERFDIRGRDFAEMHAEFVPFTATTRMSGIDYQENTIRKGAADAVRTYVTANGGTYPKECDAIVSKVAGAGGTPLVVVRNNKV
ncbi:potassium-transporting ATPase subunit B, partial [Salmonella enterica subsp. enterica serovar Typhimurium]|nr:potassium-transporting ATPase subunit B [Salmonella enterica subsp. enterica serovar Typhimurium]